MIYTIFLILTLKLSFILVLQFQISCIVLNIDTERQMAFCFRPYFGS